MSIGMILKIDFVKGRGCYILLWGQNDVVKAPRAGSPSMLGRQGHKLELIILFMVDFVDFLNEILTYQSYGRHIYMINL